MLKDATIMVNNLVDPIMTMAIDVKSYDCYSRDSGVSTDEEDNYNSSNNNIEKIDIELAKRIVDITERYFSDEQLVKDAFLRKHMRRNKDGYVSLKLVASFRKIKSVCKDWQIVANAIKTLSTQLEINDTNTKIRRRNVFDFSCCLNEKYRALAYGLKYGIDENDLRKQLNCFGVTEVSFVKLSEKLELLKLISNKKRRDCDDDLAAIVHFDDAQNRDKAILAITSCWRSSFNLISIDEPKKTNKHERRQSENEDNNGSVGNNNKSSTTTGYRSRSYTTPNDWKLGKPSKIELQPVFVGSQVTIIREPFGPDGTRGFVKRRLRADSSPY